jgi:crossover junction endodeoxyribonuclease RuvC
VVESLPGRRVQLVAVGVIRTEPKLATPQRLLGISRGLADWLDEYSPAVVAIESVFSQHNHSTVMGTAQAAGLAMLAAAQRGLPVGMHTPTEVKAAVTGNGRAEKPQVQEMVRRILGLSEVVNPPDAADALAQGITELWRPSASLQGFGTNSSATPAQKAWVQAAQQAKMSGGGHRVKR